MEDQKPPISGYRNLSATEIALINEIKAEGARLSLLLRRVENRILADGRNITARYEGADDVHFPIEASRRDLEAFVAAEPVRWASIAKTHLQQGLMALTRAVARPEGF